MAPGCTLPKIIPVKGEALALIMESGAKPRHVIRHPSAYLCPKSDGRLVIGASSLPGDQSPHVKAEHIQALQTHAQKLWPDASTWPIKNSWSGIRPATNDGNPVIGRYHDTPEGVHMALGHYRNGILLAPITAEILLEKTKS